MVVVHQVPVMLRRKVVKMRPNLMQPQNKPEKMGYNKVQKEPTKENKMLNKPQAKDKVQENPAAKEVPKEAARVQAKALALEKVERAKALEAEKALEKARAKEKAKVEIHPRIQEVPLMHPEILVARLMK
jgi:hypothetical protein